MDAIIRGEGGREGDDYCSNKTVHKIDSKEYLYKVNQTYFHIRLLKSIPPSDENQAH